VRSGRSIICKGFGIMDSKDLLFVSEVREPAPPIVYPWKTIEMDANFSGQWLVAGDLDSNGELEFGCCWL